LWQLIVLRTAQLPSGPACHVTCRTIESGYGKLPEAPPARVVQEFFAHHVASVPVPTSTAKILSIARIADAITALKTGQDVPRALAFFAHELRSASCCTLSLDAIWESGVLGFILPYADPSSDPELLDDCLTIITFCSAAPQPSDSPLQNPVLLSTFLEILTTGLKSAKETVLNTLANLFADATIGRALQEACADLNMIEFLIANHFLDLDDPTANASLAGDAASAVLSGFIHCLHRDEIDLGFADQLLPIIAASILASDGIRRASFLSALAGLLRSAEVADVVRQSEIPEMLRKSLALYHDDSVPDLYDCVHYLTKGGDVPDCFRSESFASSTVHLLARGNSRDALHILRAVGSFTRGYEEMEFARGIVAAAAGLIGAGPFDVKKAALFVVLGWLRGAPQEAAAQILGRATIDAMCAVAPACETQDVVYFLDTCARLDTEIVRAMAERSPFMELLEDFGNSEVDEVVEYVEELWAVVAEDDDAARGV
jgi:hypothetical protein